VGSSGEIKVSEADVFQVMVLAAGCITAAIIGIRRALKKPAPHVPVPQKPEPRPEVVQRIKERMLVLAKQLPPIPVPAPGPTERSTPLRELEHLTSAQGDKIPIPAAMLKALQIKSKGRITPENAILTLGAGYIDALGRAGVSIQKVLSASDITPEVHQVYQQAHEAYQEGDLDGTAARLGMGTADGLFAALIARAAVRGESESVAAFEEVRSAWNHAAPAESEPRGAVAPRATTAQCEAIRQKLRPPLMYDEEKIDRLIAMERERLPYGTEEQLYTAAYEHWVRDNH
jgi:hypothetical protein